MGVRRPLPATDLAHVLRHTEDLWEDLRGERLFITGGTGFIGGWMVESLLRADLDLAFGVRMVLLTRDPDRFRAVAPHVADHPAVTLARGTVRDFEPPSGAFAFVLHLATETKLDGAPLASFTTAVEGTQRVLDLAARSGTRRLLLTSSGAVYGPQPPDIERLGEDYPGALRPDDATAGYGHGKRAAEFLCVAAAASSGPEVAIARCFSFVGPLLPLDAKFAIGNFIRDAMAGGPIRVSGDGTPRRSYLYAADLAVWLWTILLRGASGRPYNVGSESSISILDLAGLIANTVRPSAKVTVALSTPAPGLPSRYVPSTDRASSELGLNVLVSLPDAVRRTADWHR